MLTEIWCDPVPGGVLTLQNLASKWVLVVVCLVLSLLLQLQLSTAVGHFREQLMLLEQFSQWLTWQGFCAPESAVDCGQEQPSGLWLSGTGRCPSAPPSLETGAGPQGATGTLADQ